MKSLVIILVLVILRIQSAGQLHNHAHIENPDSLLNRIPEASTLEKISLFNQMAAHYSSFHFDSSMAYSNQAMRMAMVQGSSQLISMIHKTMGDAYYYKMDFGNALISYLAALKLINEKAEGKSAGDIYLQLGNINFFIKRTEKTKAYYQKALACYQTIGDEDSAADVFEALCVALDNLGYEPIDTAMYYGFKLLEHARKVSDPYREAFAMMMIGQNCITEDMSGKYDPYVIPYNDSALKIASDHSFHDLIAIINLNLGSFYSIDKSSGTCERNKDLSKSRFYTFQAISASEKWESNNMLALSYINLANLSHDEEKYQEAEKYLDQCEANLNDYFEHGVKSNIQVRIGYSFSKIIDYYLAQRTQTDLLYARHALAMAEEEMQKALDYLQLYYQSLDTLNAAQQSRQFELMMTEAEAEKTEQKIRTLSQENEVKQLRLNQSLLAFAGGGGLIIFSSLFILMFIQRKRSKAEQKSVLMEQRLLRAQMNPHFLFKSLASIQNYILNERPDEASTYLSRFSQLVRDVLDNSVEEFVLLSNEINAITNYLELQKARYEDHFSYSLEVDKTLDTDSLQVPPMLAQPFIENAIEHGVKYKETAGHIRIRFMADDNMIRFEVEDDGVGREKALELESKHKTKHRSMSTSITLERLGMLGKKFKKKIKLEIIDLKDDQGNAIGTKVTFGIPVVEG